MRRRLRAASARPRGSASAIGSSLPTTGSGVPGQAAGSSTSAAVAPLRGSSTAAPAGSAATACDLCAMPTVCQTDHGPPLLHLLQQLNGPQSAASGTAARDKFGGYTMSVATQAIPTGVYNDDGVHSSIGFEVKHMVVATFRGRFDDYKAGLTVDENGEAKLVGVVETNSVKVKDENLAAHLQSPDFFDAERTPQLRFESTRFDVEDGRVSVTGDLTIKGHTESVEGTGLVTELIEDFA